jgi:hypothetical protein
MAVASEQIFQLRIELRYLHPPIWRRVAVPAGMTLRRLHDVIQAVFLWQGAHLHQFEVGDTIYGRTEFADEDLGVGRAYSDRNIRLEALIARGVKRFVYLYDFGDGWEHLVTIQRVGERKEGVEYPVLLAGARRAPPDDCGGPPGFENFLDAMADDTHPEHAFLLDWYGGRFDPADMELETVEAMLGRIRASRRKGPARGSRSTSKRTWQRKA